MPELHLSISFRFLLILLAAMLSAAGTMFFYRVTVPPISNPKRFVLVSLRSFGIFILFLLVGEPLLSLITYSIDQPIVSVLVDNSKSMTIQDQKMRRDKVVESVLRSDIWRQLGKKCKLQYGLFDGKARYLTTAATDSLTFSGESTNISEALKRTNTIFASSNLQAVVIITDGISTVGLNPTYEAEDLGVPIFTIGIGDTSDQKDLIVRKVLTNDIAYVGTKIPVNVTVHSSGFGGERVHVSVQDNAKTYDEKTIMLERGTRDYSIPLSVIPNKEGLQKYTVETSNLPGELTVQNNRMNFFIKVLKSKLHILLIAGSPGQDVAFICEALRSDNNIEMKSFIERNEGRFYENSLNEKTLHDADCLLLVGFPTARSSSAILQLLSGAVSDEKPFLIILSRTIDLKKLQILDSILPFDAGNVTTEEQEVFAVVPESQRNNPILKIGLSSNSVEVWAKLPPIYQLRGTFHPKIESQILVGIRSLSSQLENPLILTRHVNRRKSLSVLGYGLWRWNMLTDAGSETEQTLNSFISNSVRWLATQEDERRVRVQSTKHIYTTQDQVEFTAQVYDENYHPVDDAQIEVRTKRGNEINPLILNPVGSGQYQSAYDYLAEGDYSFTAIVTLNGTVIGKDQGTFSVGGVNAEFNETRMNKTMLKQIAAMTRGQYYDSDKLESLPEDVERLSNFVPRDTKISAEIEIWNSRWMLALVVIIFSVEWFIRKQNGML